MFVDADGCNSASNLYDADGSKLNTVWLLASKNESLACIVCGVRSLVGQVLFVKNGTVNHEPLLKFKLKSCSDVVTVVGSIVVCLPIKDSCIVSKFGLIPKTLSNEFTDCFVPFVFNKNGKAWTYLL